ncbi:hypothetical protein BD311DRAFT_824097 [Dichomitus squalens]|uniref:Protein kinase domain-containing protein n=1 Tax=Dichomitus squalens TaxID=114155 RepID=A0A4Q9M8G7_9APHY|nr:hypothetical protein BD311DRAFT_824097 [Dichomitus squalens]
MPQPEINGRPGVAILFHGCTDITIFRPLRYPHPHIDENSFATLPPTGYIRTTVPRIRGKKYDYASYTTWQLDWHTDTPLVFGGTHHPRIPSQTEREPASTERPQRFALKLAANVGNSRMGKALMEKLIDEAIYYTVHLSSVQGEAVPKHYGIWCGITDWDVPVAISIMQWGGRPYLSHIKDTKDDTLETRKAVLRAYHALHQKAGIEHDNHSAASDGHILYDHVEEKAYIVDFSRAFPGHKCALRMPLFDEYPGIVPDPVFGCRELLLVSRLVGMTRNASYLGDPTGRMQAFVDQYFEEHPEAESDVEVDSDDEVDSGDGVDSDNEGPDGVDREDEVDSAE